MVWRFALCQWWWHWVAESQSLSHLILVTLPSGGCHHGYPLLGRRLRTERFNTVFRDTQQEVVELCIGHSTCTILEGSSKQTNLSFLRYPSCYWARVVRDREIDHTHWRWELVTRQNSGNKRGNVFLEFLDTSDSRREGSLRANSFLCLRRGWKQTCSVQWCPLWAFLPIWTISCLLSWQSLDDLGPVCPC